MNTAVQRRIRMALALFLATLAQGVYADAMTIRGAHPDFLVATAILCAMFCDANEGAGIGFFAGLLHACLATPPQGGFGSLIVSRTLVGFGVGWMEERIFRDTPLLALALVPLGTLLAEGLFYLFAPQAHPLHWARLVGLTAIYNTVLAWPLYLLLHRLLGKHREVHS